MKLIFSHGLIQCCNASVILKNPKIKYYQFDYIIGFSPSPTVDYFLGTTAILII